MPRKCPGCGKTSSRILFSGVESGCRLLYCSDCGTIVGAVNDPDIISHLKSQIEALAGEVDRLRKMIHKGQ